MSARDATFAVELPPAIELLRQRVAACSEPGDVTAQEVLASLTIAWAAAERWHVETNGMSDDDDVLRDENWDEAAAR